MDKKKSHLDDWGVVEICNERRRRNSRMDLDTNHRTSNRNIEIARLEDDLTPIRGITYKRFDTTPLLKVKNMLCAESMGELSAEHSICSDENSLVLEGESFNRILG